ncbi:hypothetical protein [Ligilactobacillus acidipiscis]|uniref:hypothetical protein n=1 Tax=Ligilactobacillus acidipiscis TaxID=89059 RepID=UPI0023F90C1A|nr:hypothetical protein [Ligilactobacillus acidipiscis]WEV56687.1 hypothetical protein OZX66_10750 [Ligilactobacillus acidipiscis]
MNTEKQFNDLINVASKNIYEGLKINDAMIQFRDDMKKHCETLRLSSEVEAENLNYEQSELYIVATGIMRERSYIQDMRWFNLKRMSDKNKAEAKKIFPKCDQFLNDNEVWCEDHLSQDEYDLLSGVAPDCMLGAK